MRIPRKRQCELCLAFHEELAEVCFNCAGDLRELGETYTKIVVLHPKLRKLSPARLMQFLYEKAKPG